MFHFIIYEDDSFAIKKYKSIIRQFIGNENDYYQILCFQDYKQLLEVSQSLSGIKIFILDIEVPNKSGLDLARDIRSSGDWRSQIIIISIHDIFQHTKFTRKTLILDFISKRDNVQAKLLETLNLAYQITTDHCSFSFHLDGDLYHIPYQDILYFEKVLHDNSSLLVTVDNSYTIHESITSIEKELSNDVRFLRTHQSCIVNLFHIRSVSFKKQIIYFDKDDIKIPLLARNSKKELREKLTNCGIL